MKDFAAIDFETANYERSSVCAVGIVIVRHGEIVDSFYSLIHPEPNYYISMCSEVNGLSHQDTDASPSSLRSGHRLNHSLTVSRWWLIIRALTKVV